MKTRAEIIAGLVPHVAQGIAASDDWNVDAVAVDAFNVAEAIYEEGVERGIYPKEPEPEQS